MTANGEPLFLPAPLLGKIENWTRKNGVDRAQSCTIKDVSLFQNNVTLKTVFQKQKKKHKNPSAVNFSALHLINDPQGKTYNQTNENVFNNVNTFRKATANLLPSV